jgi:hypothetical protein
MEGAEDDDGDDDKLYSGTHLWAGDKEANYASWNKLPFQSFITWSLAPLYDKRRINEIKIRFPA